MTLLDPRNWMCARCLTPVRRGYGDPCACFPEGLGAGGRMITQDEHRGDSDRDHGDEDDRERER